MNNSKVNILRWRSEGMAECEQCDMPPRNWTRERARQHAAQHGHTVHFVVEDTTTYTTRITGSEDHD